MSIMHQRTQRMLGRWLFVSLCILPTVAVTAWAMTVKSNPVISARMLPVADKTSSRLAQPRANTIPEPNISPPNIAPDIEPGFANCRISAAGKSPNANNNCTPTRAEPKTRSQTANRSAIFPPQNSMVAARRQKSDRCAANPSRRWLQSQKICPQPPPLRRKKTI